MLVGWGIAYLTFAVFATVVPVGPRFERYAAEFIGRVDYAVYPAAVILAAYGAGWAWSSGALLRLASAGLVALAFRLALKQWLGWMN